MIKFILLIVLAGHAIDMAESSSIKMDFLPFANVRTDPIINPNELSDHIHTFYGATAARPETTYEDLRNAYGGSGDAEENQSLYWHPTVYRVDSENGVHHMVDMHIASAYYIWTPGVTRAFPNGFKMISFIPEEEAVGFFDEEPSEELETEIWFPDCWDGINLDSNDHMSHVAFSSNRDVSGTCPDTHPVKIPKIEFFVRVAPYLGGTHVFSDGTTRLHADYFSGWDQEKLQHVLDNCDNGSFESAPDMVCGNRSVSPGGPIRFPVPLHHSVSIYIVLRELSHVQGRSQNFGCMRQLRRPLCQDGCLPTTTIGHINHHHGTNE